MSSCTLCVGSHYMLCNWLQMKTPKYSSTWKIFDTSGSPFRYSLQVTRVIILSFTSGWIENFGRGFNCSSCDVCAALEVLVIHMVTSRCHGQHRWLWLGNLEDITADFCLQNVTIVYELQSINIKSRVPRGSRICITTLNLVSGGHVISCHYALTICYKHVLFSLWCNSEYVEFTYQ